MPPASRPSPNTPAASSNTPPLWTIPQLTRRLPLLLRPSRLSCKSHPQRRQLFRRPRPPSKNNPGAAPTTKSSTCFHGSSFKLFPMLDLGIFFAQLESPTDCARSNPFVTCPLLWPRRTMSVRSSGSTRECSVSPEKQLLPCSQLGPRKSSLRDTYDKKRKIGVNYGSNKTR